MHLQGMTVQKQMVLQRWINHKIKCRKDKLKRCLSISTSLRLLQTTYSHIIAVCKPFSCSPKQHMLFRLLKDAWLSCNRCSLSVLLTPFWSPIRHLLRTAWQPIDWLPVTDPVLARILLICRWSVWNYVMTFQKSRLYFRRIRMKRSLYRRRMKKQTVDGPGYVSAEWITSVFPWKLCEKHPRI